MSEQPEPVSWLVQAARNTTHWVAYTQQECISYSSGGCEVHEMSGQNQLPYCNLQTVTSHSRRGEGALWALIHKAINPIYEGRTLIISSPLKGPIPNTITLGVR